MNLRDRMRWTLEEDLGPGDLTTEATIPADLTARAQLVAKQDLVVSGHRFGAAALHATAERLGVDVSYTPMAEDGAWVTRGTTVAEVQGNARAMLIGERPALNLMMRACGIATHVHTAMAKVGEATFRAVDTRKTTPLWRDLEKDAVRHGGGHNHRFGLFDGVLIKENHIASVGSVAEAVRRARATVHHLIKIEVEVTRIDQIAPAIDAGADGLLLDNMDDATLMQAIEQARTLAPRVFLEASGNMDAERMARIAHFGLDVVSVGGFVHQARWADLSLRFEP